MKRLCIKAYIVFRLRNEELYQQHNISKAIKNALKMLAVLEYLDVLTCICEVAHKTGKFESMEDITNLLFPFYSPRLID